MMTWAQMPPLSATPAELRWLRGRVAGLEARTEVLAARLAARDAQLEAAQAQLAVLAVLAKQAGELAAWARTPPRRPSRHPQITRTRKSREPSRRPVRAAAGQVAGQIVADGPPAGVVTEDLLADVYRVQARVIPHPANGLPAVVPLP